MSAAVTLDTHAPEETERLGRALARLLPSGSLVALYGELATGKTCLVRGMAAHFAQDTPIHSPTFTLVNEYGNAPKLYHLDLYRLSLEQVADLGYEEIFDPGDAVTVIEWAERAESLLPERRVDVHLEHAGHDARRIRIDDRGVLRPQWEVELTRRDWR